MSGAVATLLLADARFPAGSYAHSLSLEQAVADGLGVDGVAGFIAARQALVARSDAAPKLLGLDPAQTARWLAELAPAIGAAARAVAADERPLAEQPPPAAIGLELAATIHAQRTERLLVS